MARRRPSRRAAVHAKTVQAGRRRLGGSRVTRPSVITSEHAVIQAEPHRSGYTARDIVTNLTVHIRVDLSRRFSELAVFDARLYIRVRLIDQPA